ncbi:MAG: hypothetical protein WC797_00530 [Candidatus Paceibacterota bacterium]
MTIVILPELDPSEEPRFNAGQRVWVIVDGVAVYVEDVTIRSILFELCENGKGKPPVLICTGYRLSEYNPGSGSFFSSPDEVYATKEVAEELAKWYPVKDVSEAEWKQAIGDRQDDESLDSCELPSCCANISDARDIFAKCQQKGGLIERDVRRVRGLLEGHYPVPSGDSKPTPTSLDKIMAQLGLL